MTIQQCCILFSILIFFSALRVSEAPESSLTVDDSRQNLARLQESDPCVGGRGAFCFRPPGMRENECVRGFKYISVLAEAGELMPGCKSPLYVKCRWSWSKFGFRCTGEISIQKGEKTIKRLVGLDGCKKT